MSRYRESSEMKNPPTPTELSRELKELSENMLIASHRIAYVGGLDPVYAQHAAELAGAAKLVTDL